MKADAIATAIGKPLARLDKRALDARPYVIDCAPLLRQHELLVSAEVASRGLVIGRVRAVNGGRFLEVHIGAADQQAGKLPANHVLRLVATTNLGALEVAVAVRVVE